MSVRETDAFARLVGARRDHDQGHGTQRDPLPLAVATVDWIAAAGISIESGAQAALAAERALNDAIFRALQALANAEVSDRDRSPTQAARLRALAWSEIKRLSESRRT